MKCEDFAALGLDAGRDSSLNELERVAARQHAGTCSRCASLQDSWQAARQELQALAAETQSAAAPPRVEMRLRQEFRRQHHTVKVKRFGVVAAWALAAAAVLVGVVSWHNWNVTKQQDASNHFAPAINTPLVNQNDPSHLSANHSSDLNVDESLVADTDGSGFTFLPGMAPTDTEDAAIMQVRLQRRSLGAMGLPVNPDAASDWVQVDLLVGNDGQPQAVRIPQEQLTQE